MHITYNQSNITTISPLKISKFWYNLLKSLIYIYVTHPQTDCFALSELFSVARHVGRSKPRSKPIQLYVRLYIYPFRFINS